MTITEWLGSQKKLLSKATPGPWSSNYHNRTDTWAITYPLEGKDEFGQPFDTCNYKENIIARAMDGSCRHMDNFDFIASVRTEHKRALMLIEKYRETLQIIEGDLFAGLGNEFSRLAYNALAYFPGDEK